MNYVRVKLFNNSIYSVEPLPSQGGFRNIDSWIKIGGKYSVSTQIYNLDFILFGQAIGSFLQEYLCPSDVEGADYI